MKTIHDYAGWAGRLPSNEPAEERRPKRTSGGLEFDGANVAQFRPALSPQEAAEELMRRQIIGANCSPGRSSMWAKKRQMEAEVMHAAVVAVLSIACLGIGIMALMRLL